MNFSPNVPQMPESRKLSIQEEQITEDEEEENKIFITRMPVQFGSQTTRQRDSLLKHLADSKNQNHRQLPYTANISKHTSMNLD